MANESTKWLYEQLKSRGYNVGKDQAEFDSLMTSNAESRQWAYDTATSLGMNVGKDVQEFTSLVAPAQQAPQASQPQTPQPEQPSVEAAAEPEAAPGWRPSIAQQHEFETQRQAAQAGLEAQGAEFKRRMDATAKGNRPGAFMGERETPGETDKTYYTRNGMEAPTQQVQHDVNAAERATWEAGTDEGRRSKEQRMQWAAEDRLSTLWQRHDPEEGENAAEAAWNAAYGRQRKDADANARRNYGQYAAMGGGRELGMVTAAMNRHDDEVSHMSNYDLDRMMDEAWDNLGADGQQAVVDDCMEILSSRYPGADRLELYEGAKAMARQQSDRRMYDLAVEKNMPKGNLDYLARKVRDANLIGNVSKGLAVAEAGTTGDMAAYEESNERYRQDGHKVVDVAGTVAGFALDPTMWLSGVVGGAGARAMVWSGGRWLAGRGASAAAKAAGQRAFASTLTGRILTGVAAGAANFGTYEGVKEAETQFAHGGHVVGQDESGRYNNEGYSVGAIFEQAAHGAVMGGAVGWLTPVSGNVADALVRGTASTAGKVATRAGVYAGATVAEGTIFAAPEMYTALSKGDTEQAFDVWTDNMAMMVGFKAKHMIKSAGGVLGDLKASFESPANGQKNRLDFESRLRMRMDAPSDGGLGLTKDERAELERYGYGDLNELVESQEKWLQNDGNAGQFVNRVTDMIEDGRVSEAARAKMYYYATGRMLPMSTVMRGELSDNGDGSYTVESQGANGVITSRTFKSRKAADLELERINRQVELNSIEVGERYQQNADQQSYLKEAFRRVAAKNNWDPVAVAKAYEAWLNYDGSGDKDLDVVQWNIVSKARAELENLGEYKPGEVTDKMRGAINEKYGVDIDAAIRKEANRRTQAEQAAIDEYIDELIPKRANERYTDRLLSSGDTPTTSADVKLLPSEPGTPADEFGGGEPVDPRLDNATEVAPETPQPDSKPIGRAVMKYQDRPVEVLSGRVVMMEDGTMVDNERSDNSIVIRDIATGKIEMVSPDSILSYEEYPADMTEVDEAPAMQADTPEAPSAGEQPKYTSGLIKIRNSDGTETRGWLTGYVDEDGKHEYYVEGDLKQLHYATDSELDSILSDYKPDAPQGSAAPAEEVPTTEATAPEAERPLTDEAAHDETYRQTLTGYADKPDEEIAALIEALTEANNNGSITDAGRGMLKALERIQQERAASASVPETEESVPNSAETAENPPILPSEPDESVPTEGNNAVENIPATERTIDPQPTHEPAEPAEATVEPTPLERIPRNEKGEPMFEQADSPETAWDALVEFSEGDVATAKEIADVMAEEKRKAFEKAQKLKPKGKTPTEILASKKANAAELARADEEYSRWQQMAQIQQQREDAVRSQQEAEARRVAAERAEAEKAEREAREEAARLEREALEGIPEWHMDTPDNARKRGVRRFGGQMYTRQDPLQGVAGKEVEVKFSQKDLPKGRVAVIEAAQLQPSHIQGQRNPMFFIDEAQPKNRAEAVSMSAAKEIAEGIRPQEITGGTTAYSGAPTVNARGEVIQGNNRSDALRYLWDSNLPQQQQAYKQHLIDNAEQFGIDPEAVNAMQQPVLVNMLDVDDAEAIRLGQMTAQDTESGGVERIKPKNVAQKLGEDMRNFANRLLSSSDEEASFGQLVDRNGGDVLKWMNQVGAITSTQYQSAFDSKGNLTAEAKNDLQKVLYQSVFKGGSQQLEEMFDRLPAKAQRAILSTAFRDMDSPFAGKMLPEIQASIAAYNQLMENPAFAEAKNLESALRAVEAFKRSFALDDRFEQYRPADNFSNFALHLAALYKASDMSQSTIAGYFNKMYDLAQGKVEATLFEEADTTEYPLAEVIKRVLNIDYQPAKNGNNDNANGGSDVALRNSVSPGGEPRGAEPPADGEQAPAGAEPAVGGAGASDDSGRGGAESDGKSLRTSAGVDEATRRESLRINPEEADRLLSVMEREAETVADIELSATTWAQTFDKDGKIVTPIGMVKMGGNQATKFFEKGREKEFGMVGPTLSNPDVIINEPSEAKDGNTERASSFLFIKTFNRDGKKIKFYASITVSQDGLEVSISSHYMNRNKIARSLSENEVVYIKGTLLSNSSEWRLAEHQNDVPDLLPTQESNASKSKEDNRQATIEQPTEADTETQDAKLSGTSTSSRLNTVPPSGDKVSTLSSEEQADGEKSSLGKRVAAASEDVNTNPTEAQKEAGNYKKGHVKVGSVADALRKEKARADQEYETLMTGIRDLGDGAVYVWNPVVNFNGKTKWIPRYAVRGEDGEIEEYFITEDGYLTDEVDSWHASFETREEAEEFLDGFKGPKGKKGLSGELIESGEESRESRVEVTNPEAETEEDGVDDGFDRRFLHAVGGFKDDWDYQGDGFGEVVPEAEYRRMMKAAPDELYQELTTGMTPSQLDALGKMSADEFGKTRTADEARERGLDVAAVHERLQAENKLRDHAVKRLARTRQEREREELQRGFEEGLTRQAEDLKGAKAPAPMKPRAFEMARYASKSAEVLKGVYHDSEGYAVASNGQVLVASKAHYDDKHRGKAVTKDGDIEPGRSLTNWGRIVENCDKSSDEEQPVSVARLNEVLTQARAGITARIEAEGKKATPARVRESMVAVRFADGRVNVYQYGNLEMMLEAAKEFGVKELNWNGWTTTIRYSGKEGHLMLIGGTGVEAVKYPDTRSYVEYSEGAGREEGESADALQATKSAKSAKFARQYETSDGKTVHYTSERTENYGGLFDFDFSGEVSGARSDKGRGENDGVGGTSELQRGGDNLLAGGDHRLNKSEGEFSLIERVFRETGSFNFTSGARIENADDVAYIFSALEDAAKEHSFAVYVKDGKPTVVELGMGTFTNTMVDIPTASLAYGRIKPDQVYFVHNHPSGNLLCSAQDVDMLKRFEKMCDVPVYGVIINLKTGKYGTYDTKNNTGVRQKHVPAEEHPLAVHTLDKQIFAADYDPMAQPLVRNSQDVAQFLNSHRMGDRAKVSFLILSRSNRIVGNIHTPYTTLSGKEKELARYISEKVIQFGGESAILYGDFPVRWNAREPLMELKTQMEASGTRLLDAVQVEGNHTRSAQDEGMVREPGAEYDRHGGDRAEHGRAEALGEAVVKMLGDAGVTVVTDEAEMRAVLEAEGRIEAMRTYHGTGATFDAFDHSHIGEGAGGHVHGRGTYVTEANGVAKYYAGLGQNAHIIYEVEIPEDNGKNYLPWKGRADMLLDRVGVTVEEYEAHDISTGEDLYRYLEMKLGGAAAASDYLSRAGFTGISYPVALFGGAVKNGPRNYVIFKEGDAKIVGRTQFMRTSQGEVYGFVKDGKVYLDPERLNPNTPIHEYTHLWDKMVQRENPELWERGKELLKQTRMWEEVKNDPQYSDIAGDEDLLASEVHSRLAGAEGERRLNDMMRDAGTEPDLVEKAQKVSLVHRIKAWLGDMFKSLKATLGRWSKRDLSELTVEEFSRMPLRDLADGLNPNRTRAAFESRRRRAEEERGSVAPGLNRAEVRVVAVDPHEFKGERPIAQAKAWAREHIVGEHEMSDGTRYEISNRAVNKYLSGSATGKSENMGVHLSVLTRLPEVINASIKAETHPDYKKGEDGVRRPENGIMNQNLLIHRLYGAVEIDGVTYRVKTTMQEFAPGFNEANSPHSFEVTKIEVLDESNTSKSGAYGPISSDRRGLTRKAANLLRGVEKSYDKGKKLLEESRPVNSSVELSFREVEGDAFQTSPEAKRGRAESLARELNTPVRIVNDVNELKSADPVQQEEMRRKKGFYDVSTGEVVIVVPNNRDVEDVTESVFHEVVAHKGLRELVGEENYAAFLDETYDHLGKAEKQEVDEETTRRFMDDPGKGYEHHRRVAVDEMFGRMAEKGFEDFTKAERGIWAKLKAKVLEAINKFLGSLKLPKWVKLGDNELRYMLWKSRELLRGKGDYVAQARDAAKRHELGLDRELRFRDPGETDDIWKDKSLGLEERITAAAIRMSNNQRGDLTLRGDAMKAVVDNLQSLMHDMRNRRGVARSFAGADHKVAAGVTAAMKAQTRYDRSTVKRVVDLARVLMQSGYLSGMTSGETQRLLSAIKNVTGMQDIADGVQTIMDIMVDNQLRGGEGTLRQLLAVRASKVDARGVEVQGALDVDGQAMVSVMKENMHHPAFVEVDGELKPGPLEALLKEATDKMGNENPAVADKAAIEYAGLLLAKEYAEKIAWSKAEEKQIRKSLSEAEERKKAGELTADVLNQMRDAAEDAIRENKIARAQAYFELVGKLAGDIRESMLRAKEWRDKEIERVRNIQHLANSDMEGRALRGQKPDTRLQKLSNSLPIRIALMPMANLDQMLRMFGSKNANGEGYLTDYFMRNWIDAIDKEQLMKERYHKLMDDKAAEIFGKKKRWYTAKMVETPYTYTDLYGYVETLPKSVIEFWDGTAKSKYELSQGALAYLYAVEKMPMGRATNRNMGIDESLMASIEASLDPKLKAYTDWMQEELFPQLGMDADETYLKLFGAHMDVIENYFPFVREKDALKRDVQNGDSSGTADRITVYTGFIKKRQASVAAWHLADINILDVAAQHVTEACHWTSFAELNRDLGTLLSYNHFKQQVKAMSSVYGAGDKLWKMFENVCAIATDCYEPKRSDADKYIVQGIKGVTMGKISFRFFTALKQTLSLPAFAGEVNPKYIAMDLGTAGVLAVKWAWKNMPSYRKRIMSRTTGDYRLRETEYDGMIMKAASFGMLPNVGVDAWTIAVGSHGVYLTKKNRYLRYGMDEEQAERRAVQDAEICFNRSQQSSEGAFLAPVQVDHTFTTTTAMLFRNSSTSYTREAHSAARNLMRIYSGEVDIDFMAKQWLRTLGNRSVSEKFDNALAKQVAGELPQGHVYSLGKPGGILLSAGFPDMPIELSSARLAEKAGQANHVFPLDAVKGLVKALNRPIAVFRYGDDAMNVIVGLSYGGKQFLVGVHFNQTRSGAEVSSIRGLFPKDNAKWLNWISQGKATYLDHRKIQALINQQRTNLADVEYLDLEDVAKVMENFENPDIPDTKNDNEWSEDEWEYARNVAKKEMRSAKIKNTVNLAMFGWILPWLWRIGSIAPLLFLLDDSDEKVKQLKGTALQSTFAPVEGLMYGDVVGEGLNMLAGFSEKGLDQLGRSNPIIEDIAKLRRRYKSSDLFGAANDIFNILAGMGTGINPQTFTDWAVAIMDTTDDRETQRETALLVCRIMSVPQSQLDEIYFDEIGMSGEEASKLTPKEIAQRYAVYKVKRGAPLMPWTWDDEEKQGKYKKQADKRMKERVNAQAGTEVLEAYVGLEERYKEVKKKAAEIDAAMKKDYVLAAEKQAAFQQDPDFVLYQQFGGLDSNLASMAKMWLESETPAQAQLTAKALTEYRTKIVRAFELKDPEAQQAALVELNAVWTDFNMNYREQVNR